MNCANHPDRERVAFCQDCGKPLCQECTRTIGSAVYCEESLAARLGGSPPNNGGTYTAPPAGSSYAYTGNVDYGAPGAVPPPLSPGAPNPGLAALLGLIPGVGAMYNGQYAKGVIHLMVFAVLISLADQHGIFGLFIAGWICYQVIEAHHTARARRDGTPLPNPFGLNDIGERLGFGKSWPGASAPPSTPPPAGDASAVPPAGSAYAPPSAGYQQAPQAAAWSAPQAAPWESYAPPVPPIPPYGAPAYPIDPNMPIPRNRFPAGAVWLIGLGCLFLIGNSGWFFRFPIHHIVPFLLIGLGVWLFVHKMTESGTGLADDGTPAYQYRLFRALRGSVWVILLGVLFLLDSFDILSWGRSWPLFLLVAGLMALFQRFAYNTAVSTPYPYQPPPTAAAAPPTATGTSIVPSSNHDQEGS